MKRLDITTISCLLLGMETISPEIYISLMHDPWSWTQGYTEILKTGSDDIHPNPEKEKAAKLKEKANPFKVVVREVGTSYIDHTLENYHLHVTSFRETAQEAPYYDKLSRNYLRRSKTKELLREFKWNSTQSLYQDRLMFIIF